MLRRLEAICVQLLVVSVLVLSHSTPARGEAPSLILYQANLSARTPQILRNRNHIDGLPFDGITINIPASWVAMKAGTRLRYEEVYGKWLKPLKGRLDALEHSYLLILARRPPDPFADWSRALEQWRIVARAARDAGLEGILFDNEEYFENVWHWPGAVSGERPLAAYQKQMRQRGRQVMKAVRGVWPNARIVVLHGPYVSEPRTPRDVTKLQTDARSTDLSGHFFVGLLSANYRKRHVIDGGEVYQYRSASEFSRSTDWRKRRLPELNPNPLIPAWLRAKWSARIGIGFGVYDLQWKPGFSMNPSVLERTLRHALNESNSVVWLFTEGNGPHDYLRPGGVSRHWIDAIRRARG